MLETQKGVVANRRSRKKRLLFARQHRHWKFKDWCNVLFSDESPYQVFYVPNSRSDTVWGSQEENDCFMFRMYDKKFRSVTSHALYPLSLSQTVTPSRTPSPPSRAWRTLWTAPISAVGRSVKWVWPTRVSLAFSQCPYVLAGSLSCCGVKWMWVSRPSVGQSSGCGQHESVLALSQSHYMPLALKSVNQSLSSVGLT